MKDEEIKKISLDGLSVEYSSLYDKAFEIFLKRMPTSPLTGESAKGYKSAIEQSVEIAQLFESVATPLLNKEKYDGQD